MDYKPGSVSTIYPASAILYTEYIPYTTTWSDIIKLSTAALTMDGTVSAGSCAWPREEADCSRRGGHRTKRPSVKLRNDQRMELPSQHG
jgi:hypothetical protein